MPTTGSPSRWATGKTVGICLVDASTLTEDWEKGHHWGLGPQKVSLMDLSLQRLP